MKKKIKDLTFEEVFKLKNDCITTRDCDTCPLNYREDKMQSVLCELVNEIENNNIVDKFLNTEIEVLESEY